MSALSAARRRGESIRVSLDDIDLLKIYVLLSPALTLLLALCMVRLTGWMDRREDRRNASR
jgi:hypothetical protein